MASKSDDRRRRGKTPAKVKRPSPVAITLEPRFVFDAAAGGEIVAAVQPEGHADTVLAKIAASEAESAAKHDWLAKVEAVDEPSAKSTGWFEKLADPANDESTSRGLPPQAEGARGHEPRSGADQREERAYSRDAQSYVQGGAAEEIEHGEAMLWLDAAEQLSDGGGDTLYVVDSRIADLDWVVSRLPEGSYIVLDTGRDGVEQVTEFLAGRTNVSTLAFITDGRPGELQLGGSEFSVDTIGRYAADLAAWADSLAADADILLFGCDVAQGNSGNLFLQQFADLTGTDIAASTDLTGAAELGGDLELERNLGQIEADSFDALKVLDGYADVLTLTGFSVTGVSPPSDTILQPSDIQNGISASVTAGRGNTDGKQLLIEVRNASNQVIFWEIFDSQVSNGSGSPYTLTGTRAAPLGTYNGAISIAVFQGTGTAGASVAYNGTLPGAPVFTKTVTGPELTGLTFQNNAAPVNTVPSAQTVAEDTSLAIAGISVADTNGNLSTTRLTVTNGTLTIGALNGATISAGANNSTTLTLSGTQAQINAALAALSYKGNANFSGSDTLTVLSTDALGATDSDSIAITVTAVNDDPVNTVPAGPIAVSGSTPAAITGLAVADVDAGSGSISTTLSVPSGTLSVASVAGGATIGGNGSGTVTLTGTLAQINATLNGAGSSVTFTRAAGFSGNVTLTMTTSDQGNTGSGGAKSDSDQVTLSVTNPPAANPDTAGLTEDSATTTATGNLLTNDVSPGQVTAIRVTGGTVGTVGQPLSGTYGTLTVNSDGTYSYVLDNSRAATQALAAGATASESFTYTVSTSGLTSTLTVTITGTNDAPIFDVTKTPVLNFVTSSAGAPANGSAVGTLVSGLTTGAITDADTGAASGIALTATNTTNGTWWYSLNNGSTWSTVGSVSGGSALLLPSTARLYFQPNGSFSGSISNAITFKAWDQSTGSAGTKVDTSSSGGMTAFSLDADTASIAVKKPITLASDTSDFAVLLEGVRFDPGVDTQANSADLDLIGANGGPLLYGAYDATTNDLYFRVRVNNPTLSKGVPTFSAVLLLGVDLNADGKLDIFVGVDGRNNGLGVVTFDPGSGANNSPSTTSITNPQSVGGSLSYVLTGSDLGPDGKQDAYLTFRVPFATFEARAESLMTAKGTPINLTPSSALGFVLLTQTQNNSINGDIGGVGALSSAQKNISYSDLGILQPVSFTKPTLDVSGTVSYTENAAAVFVASNATVTDLDTPDFNGAQLTVSYAVQAGDRLAVVSNAGAKITVSGNSISYDGTQIGTFASSGTGLTLSFSSSAAVSKAAVEAAIRSIAYDNTSDAPVGGARSLSFILSDPETNSSLAKIVSLFVLPVNDAPLISGSALSRLAANSSNYDINTATTANALILKQGVNSGFVISDVDAGAGAIVKATLSVSTGALELYNGTTLVSGTAATVIGGVTITGSGTGTITLSGTVTDINALLAGSTSAQLLFQPGSSAADGTVVPVTFTVNDLGNSGSGGPLTATVTFANITISGAPKISGDLSRPLIEDNNLSGNNLVATGTLTANGSLTGGFSSTFQGNTVGSAASLGTLSFVGGNWTYTILNTGNPTIQNLGPGDTIEETFKVQATINGIATTAFLKVTITGANDAPTLTVTGLAQTVAEGGAAVDLFSAPSLSTVEANQSINRITVQVTSVADGQTEFLTIDGTRIALLSGTSTTAANGYSVTVTLVGSTATVTIDKPEGVTAATAATLIDGLTYSNIAQIPTNTSRSITITSVRDSGGTANGGSDTGTFSATATVNLTAVNDAPILNTGTITIFSKSVGTNTYVLSTTGADLLATDLDNTAGQLVYSLTSTPLYGALQKNIGTSGSPNWVNVTTDGAGGTPTMFTQADVDGGLIRYVVNANTGGNTENIALSVTDGTASATGTYRITIVSSNTVPVAFDATVTATEDTSVTFALGHFGFSDADAGDTISAVQIVSKPALGTLEYSLDGSTWTTVTDLNTPIKLTAAQISSGYLRYTAPANANASSAYTTFDYKVYDQADAPSSAPAAMTINVAAINDAPVASGAATLAPVNEDAANPSGATVSTLFSGNFSDATDQVTGGSSANTLAGVAITAYTADPAKGVWQYSSDGSTWTTLASVSGAATAITLKSTDSLRFVPSANFNGTPPSLTAVLVDSSTGTIVTGSTVDVSTRGGTTAFSVATVNLSTSVTAVNDAPTAANDSVTTAEDAPLTFDVRTNDSDIDGDSLTVTQINGTAISTGGSVAVTGGSVTLEADGTLTFTPTSNFNGTPSFTYTVSDGQGGTATGTVNLTVTSVNDAPTANPDTGTAGENETKSFVVLANDTDPDAGDTQTLVSLGAVTVTSANGAINGLNAAGAFSIEVGQVKFTPGSLFDGLAVGQTATVVVGYTMQDGTGVPSSSTLTITVTGTNDAPAITSNGGGANASVSVAENMTAVTTVAASDLDSATLSYTIVGGADAGKFTIDAQTGALSFVAAPDFEAPTDADGDNVYVVQVQVSDGQGGTVTQTLSVTVTNANEAPTSTADSVTTLEDTAVVLTMGDFGSFSDPDGTTFAGVRITSLPTAGTFEYHNGTAWVAVTDEQLVSAADLAAAKLRFVPVADANGAGYATIGFKVSDGTLESASAYTLTVNVTPVNDAPSGADKTITITEDGSHSFAASDFGFADGNDSPADDFAAVVITTLPSVGTLKLSGVAVTAGQFIAVADIANLTYEPVGNGNGAGYSSFTFQVRDSGGTANGGADTDGSPNTITFNVTAVNDAPVASGDSVTTAEDTPVTFDVRTNDSDADGNSLTVTHINGTVISVGSPVAVTGGTVALNADGTLTFTPNQDFNGTPSFTYTVSDGQGGTDTATVNLTVTAVNDAPVNTVAGARTTAEDTALAFAGADTISVADIDGGPLTTTLTVTNGTLSVTTGGGATITGNGSATIQIVGTATEINAALAGLTYQPTANFHGGATLSVVTTDGTATDTDTVAITVTPVNDAPDAVDDTVTTAEDTPVTFDVRTNDTDAENDGLTVTHINGTVISTGASVAVAGGSVKLEADGRLTFTPTGNVNGPTSFTYTLSDGQGGSDTATVNLTVTAVNDAPTASNDSVTTREDTEVVLSAGDFGSYADVEGTAFAGVRITALPLAGTLQYNDSATVTPNWGAVTADQDISAADLAAGRLRFVPAANANGAGYASLGFKVSDGAALSEAAYTLTVDVIAVNDAPAGTDKAITINEDGSHSFAAADFGFSDANDSPTDTFTSVIITSLPTAGTLKLDGVTVEAGDEIAVADLGKLVFAPAANANGAAYASFTFQVRDSGGTANGGVDTDPVANTITFNVTAVNDAPTLGAVTGTIVDTAADDTYAPLTGALAGTDLDAGTTLSYGIQGGTDNGATVTFAGAYGTLTVDKSSGAYTYTPDDAAIEARKANTTDVFTLTVSDGTATGTATFTVNITGANDTPTLTASVTTATLADTAAPDSFADIDGTLSASDRDAPETLTYSLAGSAADSSVAGFDRSVTGSYGTLFFNSASGAYRFVADAAAIDALAAGQSAAPSFTFTLTDGSGATDSETLTINISGANDAPIAADDSFTTAEDTAVTFDVRTNDGDVDGGTLSVTHINGTAISTGGSVSIDGGTVTLESDGRLTFTPAENYNGAPSFTYTVSDGQGGNDTATVSLTVTPVNDAPVAAPLTITMAEDTAKSGSLPAATDVDGDGVTYAKASDPAHGSVTVNANGTYTYTPSADYSGPDSFTYTVSDGQGGSNTYTVSITVTPANDAAIIGDPTGAGVTEDVSVTSGELRAVGVITISDADAGQASFKTTVTPGAGVLGTLTLNSDGSYVYAVANAAVQSLAAGEVKTEIFTIEAADGTTKDVSFTITGTNDRPVLAVPTAISLVDTASAANFAAVTGTLAAGDVDSDAELTYAAAGGTTAGGPWTFGAISYDVKATGAYGTLYLRSATGQYRFVPDNAAVDRLAAAETPTARFAFTVTDEHGATDSQDLVIQVTGAGDTAAITGTATGSVKEDATLTASGTLTLVDRDAGENVFEAPGSLTGQYGTFVFNAGTGAWSYNLDNGLDAVQSLKAGSTLTDRLTVTSKDGSANRTITVTIEGTNDKPDLATPAAISLADTTADDRLEAVEGVLSATDKDALDTKGYSGGTAVDYRVTSDTTPTLTGAMPVLPGQRLEVVLNNVTYRVGDGALTHGGGVWSLTVPTELAAGSYTLVATVHDAIGAVSSTTTTLVIDPLASALVKTYDRMASNAFGTLYLDRATGAYRFLADGTAVDALGAGETATASFGLTVTDSAGESDSADLLIDVTGANDGPRAADDTVATQEDTSVTFDVRANDSDVDGDGLTVVEIDGSPLAAGSPVAIMGGTISRNADGTLTFTPTADYSGTATFTYRVSDGNGGTTSARVTLVVTSVDDGATDIRVTGGSVLEGASKGTVAGNVTVEDPDGGTYRYELVDDAGGRFTVDADGRILVADGTLLDYETSRSHRVAVRITGPDGTSVTRDAEILVGDVNEPSVARADSYTVDQGATLTIPAASGVLANDSDPEAGPMTAEIVSGPANGTLALAADGSLVYTPNPGFAGTDQFTYRAADGSPVPGTATVTISVRAVAVPPPVIPAPPVVVVTPPAPVTPPPPPPVEVPTAPTQAFPIPVDPIVTPSAATLGSPVAETASLLVANIAPTGYTMDVGGFRTAIVESSEAALVLFRGMPDREFDSGASITFSVPNDAFAHTKSEEVVTLTATLLDGTPLPGWLAFSSEKGVFEGVPPKGYQGELVIKVVARDKAGREAAATFRVKVNGGEAATDGTETGELRAKNVKRTAGIPLNAGRVFADVRAKATALAKRL